MGRPPWLAGCIPPSRLLDVRTGASPWYPCPTPRALPAAARNWLADASSSTVAGLLLHRRHRTPHRVLARHLRHSQQLGIDSITPYSCAHSANAPPAPITESCQYIPLLRCVRALVLERAVLHPGVEPSTGLQKLDEEGHQPQAAHGCFWCPLHLDLAAKRIHVGDRLRGLNLRCGTLTFRVNRYKALFVAHLKQYELLLCSIERADRPF